MEKQFTKAFVIFLFFLISLQIVCAACSHYAYLSHGTIDGKYYASILASCDDIAMENVKVTVSDSKGKVTEGVTNKNGEFLFNPQRPGTYFFDIEFLIDGNKINTDRKVVYKIKPTIIVNRTGNNYLICSEQNLDQFEIEDAGKLAIIKQVEGCAYYTTDSNRFLIKTPETDVLEASEMEAGMFIRAVYPETVLSGKSFSIALYDNSMPLQGANVEIAGTRKITDSKGIVAFILKTPTSYEIKAWKKELGEFNGKINVVSELARLEVSNPAEVKPLEVFSVEVKSSGQPLSNALVSVGGAKKLTDKDGIARFAFADKGNYTIVVSKEGFESSVSTIKIFAEEKRLEEFIVSMPAQAYEDKGFVVTVSSKKGAVKDAIVRIGDKSFSTDNVGKATVSGIPAGTYSVYVEKEGFKTTQRKIEIISLGEPEQAKPLPAEFYYAALGIALFVFAFGVFRFWQKRRLRYL